MCRKLTLTVILCDCERCNLAPAWGFRENDGYFYPHYGQNETQLSYSVGIIAPEVLPEDRCSAAVYTGDEYHYCEKGFPKISIVKKTVGEPTAEGKHYCPECRRVCLGPCRENFPRNLVDQLSIGDSEEDVDKIGEENDDDASSWEYSPYEWSSDSSHKDDTDNDNEEKEDGNDDDDDKENENDDGREDDNDNDKENDNDKKELQPTMCCIV